mmetsp:Transcript_19275/g.46404  ORF Transcript_19275/g.46404 Transcript_19275/m.46404 type:complete len:463 (-) Transcript_19275:34-1422(-)
MGKKGKKKGRGQDQEALKKAAEEAAAEAHRRELMIRVKRLKMSCDAEEKQFNLFLQEREKINYFWIVEKKTLQEKQAELRNKTRELQDLQERQQIEIKMFQQRLKHLRYHEQDEIVELKTDAETALKLQEDQHRVAEAELKKDKRAMKMHRKEVEIAQDRFIRTLKLEQDQQVMALRKEYDRKARDLQQKYTLRMRNIREEMERARRQQVQEIEKAKKDHIDRCMRKNAEDFQHIKVYYNDITSSNLDLIKRLKDDHADIKKRESSDAKTMLDLQQRNRQLAEPLKRAEADVNMLRDELRAYESDKKKLHDAKEKIREQERSLARTEFQKEVLGQQLEAVTSERDDLYAKFQGAIYDVQQKSGLSNLLLEKKLGVLEETIEVTDTQVSELMVSGQVDQGTIAGISQKLEQVIAYKNDILTELHEEVQKIKDAHAQMVKTYESKLAEYGIPLQELGFVPAVGN